MFPKKLEDLIEVLKRFPGVGEKTAQRYAFQVLNWSNEEVDQMIEALENIKTGLKYCVICGNISEDDVCEICKDHQRDKTTICVVQSMKDVIAMERTQTYQGLYHVLNGAISTSKGIFPHDLNIDSLVTRCDDETIKEVIIATNPTVEGETTALYLAKLLEGKPCKVTRIAHGIPMGGHLDYADELTLIKAMEGRNELK